MAQLLLNTQEAAFITAIENDLEPAFADGTSMPGGTPNPIPPYSGYAALPTEQKDLAKNAIKPMLAALTHRLGSFNPTLHVIGSGGEPAFANAFAVWGDGNYSNGQVRYYLTMDGEVALEGLIKTPPTGTTVLTMFTLPVGHRPNSGKLFTCTSTDAHCVVEVFGDGRVVCRTSLANNTWLSLDGIRFRVVAT